MRALFTTIDEIKKNSVLSGNIDPDKIIQFAWIAQDIQIQDYLGTALYERLQAGVIAGNLNVNEQSLLDNYISPMLIHLATAEYLPFGAYTVANSGIYKHGSEQSESVDKVEVDFLVQKARNIADYYIKRFIDYMCYNAALFPQYNQNINDDLTPLKDVNKGTGWVL